jgi:hypothetical protein
MFGKSKFGGGMWMGVSASLDEEVFSPMSAVHAGRRANAKRTGSARFQGNIVFLAFGAPYRRDRAAHVTSMGDTAEPRGELGVA